MKTLAFLFGAIVSVGMTTAATAESVQRLTAPPAAVRNVVEKEPLNAVFPSPIYFQGPGNLIGVASAGKDQTGVIFFLDPSAEHMLAGVVIGLKDQSNYLTDAAIELLPNTALARAAKDENAKIDRLRSQLQTGPKVGADGKPVMTAKPLQLQVPTSAPLDEMAYVEVGQGSKLVYAFIDPLCGHCQRAWRELYDNPLPDVRIRWTLISLGSPASTQLGAGILGSPERPAALVKAMRGGEKNAFTKEIVAKGVLLLEHNMRFAELLQLDGTPLFVRAGNDNAVLSRVDGYPGRDGLVAWLQK